MRAFLAVLFVLAFASVALSIVCLPNTCSIVRCANVDETECLTRAEPGRYQFRANGGFCGCCSSCVRVLRENENCFGTQLRGVPLREICGEGMYCDSERVVCTKMRQ